MGLDMYLEKKTYIKNWDHMKPEEKTHVTIKKEGKVVKEIDKKKITHIIEEIGYWRKVNSVHKFFVDNCGGGDDNCSNMYVNENVLADLLARCNRIVKECKLIKGKIANGQTHKDGKWVDNMVDGKYIENPELCKELLPNSEGFFFGSQGYDEWYYQDIKDTVKICKEAIEAIENGADIYYNASW